VSLTPNSLHPTTPCAKVPLFVEAKEAGIAPEFLLHWGHAGAMGTVLVSMGLIGSWMGWEVRKGNGSEVNALTLGETIREVHPKIMGGMFFFFFLGGQVYIRSITACEEAPNRRPGT
jgi:hypothetical protein